MDRAPRWIDYLDVESLVPNPRNPKAHDLAELDVSLDRFGYTEAIMIDERTGMLVSGHGRREGILARKERGGPVPDGVVVDAEGRWTVPVQRGWRSVNDDEAAAYLIAANQLTIAGGWNNPELVAALDELRSSPLGLDGIGFDTAAFDRLVIDVRGHERHLGSGDPDQVPEPKAAITNVGDLWLLGPHRLVCGDSRLDGIALTLNGRQAQMVWTDPPYGVNYVGKTADAMTIDNDAPADIPALLAAVFGKVTEGCAPGAAIYIAAPAGRQHLDFLQGFNGAGWRHHETLAWVKDRFVLGHSDYHYQHEAIIYGYLPCEGRRGRGGDGWYGDNAQSSVLNYPRPSSSDEHPTMKPVALVAHCIANSCPIGGLVLDPFSGSGTTILAAHDVGRVAAGVEFSPGYVDAACARWQALTGEKPVLAATGEPVDFLG